MNRQFTHIDCFAGPGGICTGLHAAGFNTLVAIEYIKSCCETYSANHPEVHVIHSDIRDVTEDQVLPYIPEDGVDLVTSGMPCETFSTAGNTSRSFYDDRQFLFREGIRIAKMTNAKMILFENVPAITSKKAHKDSPTLIVEILRKELEDAGYGNMIQVVLDATKFGVPQKRNRFFILATRFDDWWLSEPNQMCKPTTVGDALAGLPNVIPNSGIEGTEYVNVDNAYYALMRDDKFWKREGMGGERISNHMPMKHREYTLKTFCAIGSRRKSQDIIRSLPRRRTRKASETANSSKENVYKAKFATKRKRSSPNSDQSLFR